MSTFLMQAIPFLRTTGAPRSGEFLSALEEVVELGSRYVVRTGGYTALVDPDDLLIGPRGLGVAGTSMLIPFDAGLELCVDAPAHFHMPRQPPSSFRRTAFCFVYGPDRTFGMIARDDDVEPGRHFREALTDAIGNMKKVASLQGRIASVTIRAGVGSPREWEGVMIDEDGFRSPLMERQVRWDDVRMFEIGDRVRLTCRDAVVDVCA